MDPDSGIPSCKLGSLAATPSVSPLTAWVDAPAGMVLSSDDSRSFVADKAALTTRVFDSGIVNLACRFALGVGAAVIIGVLPRQFTINGVAGALESLFLGMPPTPREFGAKQAANVSVTKKASDASMPSFLPKAIPE